MADKYPFKELEESKTRVQSTSIPFTSNRICSKRKTKPLLDSFYLYYFLFIIIYFGRIITKCY